MLVCFILLLLGFSEYASGQLDNFRHNSSYVNVRPGAHMFYWLFYTTAHVENYTERPLIIWLQGGPGGSSTGIGNFEILGPLDLNLQYRNSTWVNNFNVLFVDNPVGTGYSYVEDLSYLTKDNNEIALDFVKLMQGFYSLHPEFENVPLYIFGQSYGGKMAVDIGVGIHEAEKSGTIKSNLRGIAMGNSWISTIDSTLTWGPLLYAAGLVDKNGLDSIQEKAMEAKRLFDEGQFFSSLDQWSLTQDAVVAATTAIDFYNILKKQTAVPDTQASPYEISRRMLIHGIPYGAKEEKYNLNVLMNNIVKKALGIPDKVIWGSQAGDVFDALGKEFMKPVTNTIEKLLNETDIVVAKYNGNLDLICDTPGQLLWVNRLQWKGAEPYKKSPRLPIWENDQLEGYYKSYGNFKFFWINAAGHKAPHDNPAGINAVLRDMTSFG